MRDSDRESLRRILLDRRDATSHEMLNIVSENIRDRLRNSSIFDDINSVGIYSAIGSEITTGGIIQGLLDSGRSVYLPAVRDSLILFKNVQDTQDLIPGMFGIMEPRETCAIGYPDILVVPAVGATLSGIRLGYGSGYYDRYVKKNMPATVCIIMDKQIVKKIPSNPTDALMDWIVTESRLHRV
ncbi:MAG: 5-formyltetrahydrofolate cyclo-ligase [Cenarchaeum sp. SB0665_bin_23]|nr:5-formyltetrahydrofolate cyclo-ligase [Cenarchaeum sp. SB0665_bin_23]MYB47104.1 5-formyltetrahydrofolate cyclo-ligase [Cenarchaeum sp. SB0662_bin_33]MYG33403.1 5-formyltetrahydrofolate cyclo-ligase [Cenarchaeum sp. SB0677_bin_16]